VKREIVRTRLDPTLLAALDRYAHSEGLTRAAAVRVLVDKALGTVGAPGWTTAYDAADEPLAWPTSPELQVEAVRRQLWRQASAGSATAAAALDRSLARDAEMRPQADVPEDVDPLAEVDALAAARRRRATDR
jgi:hypothetical protein